MDTGGSPSGAGRLSPTLARLASGPPRRRAAGYAVAVLGTVALTVSLVPVRNSITPLSKGFGFLVVVVVAAAVGGLWPGLIASVFGFLTFNFFFLPPYNTFVIGKSEYVVVLFVFLGLSILISTLLARASERAEVAEARQEELRVLQKLSAELVAAVPGPEAYRTAISELLDLFGYRAGALFVQDPQARELRERVTVGAAPGDVKPSWDPSSDGRPPERLPLTVGGRNLGLFVLQGDGPPLSPAESRVMRAFCDQFALVLERDRLLRAATEAELYRQTDAVRRQLLAAVSHDLRSPLAAIKASVTDLLGEDVDHDPQASREALESIDEETDRLTDLISNLLDMSRIEGGNLKARIQGVDLGELLAGSVDRLRSRTGLDVSLSIAEDAAVVRADPVFLDRVMTNLLDNAGTAAADSASRRVEVVARRDGDRTVLRVTDHGAGVPQGVREQLFFPFYQVTERHPRLGTGLGLAIAKGFLGLMQGEIWIEDTPGGGATFALSLPAGTASAEARVPR